MLRKSMLVTLLLTIFSGAWATAANADTLIVEGISPDVSTNQPARGASKADVIARFGEPASKSMAVGEPPISRWDYGSYVVYFEYDHVLHAVAKR